jgi:hypothetical protein
LAAVFLLVDNNLKADGPWTWNNTGTITASGSYNIITSNLSSGLHSVKILAFDEHGTNNGGPGNDPANGGAPSTNSINFYVGTQVDLSSAPSVSPTATPSPSPSPSSSPSASPSASPNPFVSPTPLPSQQPDTTSGPNQEEVFPGLALYAILIPLVIVAIGIGAYAYSKRKVTSARA